MVVAFGTEKKVAYLCAPRKHVFPHTTKTTSRDALFYTYTYKYILLYEVYHTGTAHCTFIDFSRFLVTIGAGRRVPRTINNIVCLYTPAPSIVWNPYLDDEVLLSRPSVVPEITRVSLPLRHVDDGNAAEQEFQLLAEAESTTGVVKSAGGVKK